MQRGSWSVANAIVFWLHAACMHACMHRYSNFREYICGANKTSASGMVPSVTRSMMQLVVSDCTMHNACCTHTRCFHHHVC